MLALLVCLVVSLPLFSQIPTARKPEVQRALEYLREHHQEHTEKHIRISEIPAPGGEEQQRAAFLASEFKRLNLQRVETDSAGNVLGWRPGKSDRTLVVAAHLDTVFPRGTNVKVRRDGKRLYGPGMADDGRGLIALIALAEALDHARIKTNKSILFVADVGEEGLGNLRGIRYLTGESPYRKQFDAFISIDGTEPERIIKSELGSRRYRVSVKGPGGHSFSAFGTGNPAHATGRIMARISDFPVPEKPKITFSIGRMGGGTSINAIPEETWLELDVRSVEEEELVRLEKHLHDIVKQSVDEENKLHVRVGPPLTADVQVLAIRHAYPRSPNDLLVSSARQAAEALGMPAIREETASTDSNAAMRNGIPAVTIGGGGKSGRTHSPEEWFEPEDAWKGLQQALLLILRWDEKSK